MKTSNEPVRPRRAAQVALLCVAAWPAVATAQDAAAGPTSRPERGAAATEDPRPYLASWMEARRALALETRDWRVARELLTDRAALLEREIAALKVRTAEAEKSAEEADRRRAEASDADERAKAAGRALAEAATRLEARTKALLARLPEPLRDKVKPLASRLPEGSDETKVPLAERFRNVVGILNEANKWNREVTVTTEIRDLGDGRAAETVVVYFGLGRAYYVGAGGTAAGVGVPSPQGFAWVAQNALAPAVTAVVAMQKNERPAAFVRLPVRVE